MISTLVTNSEKGHIAAIVPYIKSATRIVIHTAFLKASGLLLIEPFLKPLIEAGANVTILAGLNFYQTEPQALRTIYSMMHGYNNSKLLLAMPKNVTFHSKLYYFEEKNGMATAIIGSANLTRGGLKANPELSIMNQCNNLSPFFQELRNYVEEVEKNQWIRTANEIELSKYERKFVIYNKKRKQYEEEADKEISKLYKFDEKKLEQYYIEYQKDPESQQNLQLKHINYKQAKALLDNMIGGGINNESEFFQLYKQLVGSKNQTSLWHSGSLFRRTAGIVKNYTKFIEVIKAIHSNIEESPATVFNVGKKLALNIDDLGPNVLTEIMNTYAPNKFSVLNKNPIKSLEHFGFEGFGNPNKRNFTGKEYSKFNTLIEELAKLWKLSDLGDVDHFLNFVYQEYVKKNVL